MTGPLDKIKDNRAPRSLKYSSLLQETEAKSKASILKLKGIMPFSHTRVMIK